MEVRGTTHSIQEMEQFLIKCMPHKAMHDGSQPYSLFGSDKIESAVHIKQYQLFPYGGKQLWEERVNVRICYDHRHGTATLRISSRGMHILGVDLKKLVAMLAIEIETED